MATNPVISIQSPSRTPEDSDRLQEISSNADQGFYSKFLDEVPISGYQGYIPLIYSTKASLGVPFTEAVRRSVREFKQILEDLRTDKPIDLNKPLPKSKKVKVFDITETVPVPGYQGYVPLLWRTKSSVGVGYSRAVLQSMKEFRELQKSNPPNFCEDKKPVEPDNTASDTASTNQEITKKKTTTTDQVSANKTTSQIVSTANRIPISGYQGFIPLLWSTGTGVGLCFTDAVLRCMADFRALQEKNRVFMTDFKLPPQNSSTQPTMPDFPKPIFSSERLPIPGYQGFVPLWQTTSSLGVSFTEAVFRSMRDFKEMQAKKP